MRVEVQRVGLSSALRLAAFTSLGALLTSACAAGTNEGGDESMPEATGVVSYELVSNVPRCDNKRIGQVFFVPREEITLREGTAAEITAREESSETYYREKADSKVKTGYGMEHSPHYIRRSRQQQTASEQPKVGSPSETSA